jgi:hypothetical protein
MFADFTKILLAYFYVSRNVIILVFNLFLIADFTKILEYLYLSRDVVIILVYNLFFIQ